jgi:hypothetical protein
MNTSKNTSTTSPSSDNAYDQPPLLRYDTKLVQKDLIKTVVVTAVLIGFVLGMWYARTNAGIELPLL